VEFIVRIGIKVEKLRRSEVDFMTEHINIFLLKRVKVLMVIKFLHFLIMLQVTTLR